MQTINSTYKIGHPKTGLTKMDTQKTYKNWKYKTRHTKPDIQNWTYKNWTFKTGLTKTDEKLDIQKPNI